MQNISFELWWLQKDCKLETTLNMMQSSTITPLTQTWRLKHIIETSTVVPGIWILYFIGDKLKFLVNANNLYPWVYLHIRGELNPFVSRSWLFSACLSSFVWVQISQPRCIFSNGCVLLGERPLVRLLSS